MSLVGVVDAPAGSAPASSAGGGPLPPGVGSFSCVLSRKSLSVLRRTLQCLAKIGSEVNLEATPDALLLRTLAPSHAAFSLVTLKREYFTPGSFVSQPEPMHMRMHTQHGSQSQTQSQTPTYLKCKVALKHWLLVFRNSAHAERMELRLAPEVEKMWCTVQVAGVQSNIPFEHQTNILQADFHGAADSSYLLFKPQVFTQAIDKFAARMTEVTLAIEPEEASEPAVDQGPMVRLKNFDQNASAADTAGLSLLQESINTESDIPHSQFETIRFADPGQGVELTFNVKEVRAFLTYVESLGDFDVRLLWVRSGDPILLDMQLRHGFGPAGGDDLMGTQATHGPIEMKLVIATLADALTHSNQTTPQPTNQQQPGTPSQQHQSQQQHLSQQAIQASFLQKQSAGAIVGQATRDDDSVPATPQ